MSVWFTADTHFGHARIIDYCKRPFASVGEMDATLIANWNSRIKHKDTVWHLGDFTLFRDATSVRKYREKLNGDIHLVRGNHDKISCDFSGIFASVSDLEEISIFIDGQNTRVVLCHFAMRVWPRSHHGAWHFYGHSHGTLPDDPNALSIDVSVDCWSFFPASSQQIATRMSGKVWRPVDHHGRLGEE